MTSFTPLLPHRERLLAHDVRTLFDSHASRVQEFVVDAAGLCLDFTRQRLDKPAFAELLRLTEQARLSEAVDALFRGAIVNPTEHRPALHTALRDRSGTATRVDGRPVGPEIAATLERMEEWATALRAGRWLGATGAVISDVVNIGIGGSHLGPQLVCDALRELAGDRPRVHFVSNVDGRDLASVLRPLTPATTLFIIASKSFTTPETMLNARSARDWMQAVLGTAAASAHFVAITAQASRALEFGIAPDGVLPMWDWVGGRFSLWSAIGLPIAIAAGTEAFRALLDGAHAMDLHFRTAAPASNLPVLLALLGIWNNNVLGCETQAVIPYDERLRLFPAWLQQLEMESNGKRVGLDDRPVGSHTAPVIWGGIGTNVQHAFFQLLHQGTRRIPVDFILPLHHPGVTLAHQDALVANCIAQAEALMLGRPVPPGTTGAALSLARHREQPGNQPSNVLTMNTLTPETLGALLALYEHKTFAQGVLWGINSFDQWGVELGKQLAHDILADIGAGSPATTHDPATRALITRYLSVR